MTSQPDAAAGRFRTIPDEPGEPGVDPATFRSVMGTLPTGVTVVTTVDADGRPRGMTCSAVCSVSMTPPMLLVCLNRTSPVLQAILDTGLFLVNVLRNNREDVSTLFATPRENRFAAARWRAAPATGLPLIHDDTVAHAECRMTTAIEAGDHVVVFGTILAGDSQANGTPLMYWRRRYAPWPAHHDDAAAAIMLAAEG
jgi:flavin reductase (DIM6/NTAB) family NADH-FMN oxidoreductase RutF